MAQDNNFELQGLKTFKSPFLEPKGGLVTAQNIVIDRDSTLDARRGFSESVFGLNSFSTISNISRMLEFQDKMIISEDGGKVFYQDGSNNFQQYSFGDNTFANIDTEIRMRDMKANNNLYLTSTYGVLKIDTVSSAPVRSGMFQGLGGSAALTGGSGFFIFDTQIAYRIVWGIRDDNDNLIIGPPSERIEIAQTVGSGTTRDIELTIQIPRDATTDHFFQVYRSPMSASSSVPGNDEMGLVYEANPTSSQISAKEVIFIDATPDSLRGATIYIAPSQEDVLEANFAPPFCKDMCFYKNMAFYANTRIKHQLELTLLAVGGDSSTITDIGYSSGTDRNLKSPNDDYNTVSNFVPVSSSGGVTPGLIFSIGSGGTRMIWKITNPALVGTSTAYTGGTTGSTYGEVRFEANDDTGYNTWADSSNNGLKTFVLPKLGNGDSLGGNVRYYYHYAAWFYAFDGGTDRIVIAQSGSVYKNSITLDTLVVTFDGIVGTAGGQGGFLSDDQITIGGVSYTAITESGTPGNNEFFIFTDSTPAENVASTAKDLVRAVNDSTTNTSINAFYLSGFNDLPGKMLLERNSAELDAFEVYVSDHGDAFLPELPTTGGVSSENEVKPNRVYISKELEPEAVPLLSYIDLGELNSDIKRIFALKDGVIALKEDGIFRITGEDRPSLVPKRIENSTIIQGASTAVILNSLIYCMTNQGLVQVSESGATIISRDIESDLLKYISTALYSDYTTTSFGIAYESERKYILFVPNESSVTDRRPRKAYVYNIFTKSWSTWTSGSFFSSSSQVFATAGLVRPSDDLLYLGIRRNTCTVLVERKTRDSTDYSDQSFSATISNSNGANIEFSSLTIGTGSNTTTIQAGMQVKQSTNISTIVSIGSGNEVQVLDDDITWSAGAATIYIPVQVSVQFLPQFLGNPTINKNLSDLFLFFRDLEIENITTTFSTDFNDTEADFDVSIDVNNTGLQAVRTAFPLTHGVGRWANVRIDHAESLKKFAMNGMSITFEGSSER